MLTDSLILAFLLILTVNGFQRGFLVMIGRLLITIVSLLLSVLLLGPTARLFEYLPFLQPLAEAVNERVIRPLLPVAGTLGEAIEKLDLPSPIQNLLLDRFPNLDGPLTILWPQLSSVIARYAMTAVSFLILLILISLFVRSVVALMTNILDHVPVFGGLNHLAGLLLGAAHGCLILAILLILAGLLAPYIPQLGALLQSSQLAQAFYQLDWTGIWMTRFLDKI